MDAWEQAIAALEQADQAEFLSPEYMSAAEDAAHLFEQAARDLADSDPARAAEAAKYAVKLLQFVSLPWDPDPAQVEVRDVIPEGEPADTNAPAAIVASGIPVDPPLAWFSDPHLTGPTPLTVTKEGRIYGHIATWGTCHTTHTGRGQCIDPPHSGAGYAHFLLGSVMTAEGDLVATGPITMDTTHAGDRLTAAGAQRHYEDTGTVVADVTAGEDRSGIWISGALRPGTTPQQIRALRAAPISGDWRRKGTGMELVAALSVNVPGFPVPRVRGLVASGALQSLVAAGMLAPEPGDALDDTPLALSAADVTYLRRMADQQRIADDTARAVEASRLLARAHRASNAAKVAAFAARRKV